jgi:hypothetical protein
MNNADFGGEKKLNGNIVQDVFYYLSGIMTRTSNFKSRPTVLVRTYRSSK